MRKNIIYFHITCMGRFQEICDQMFEKIEKSNLINNVESVNLFVLGETSLRYNNHPNINLVYGGSPNEWEFPTLNHMRHFSVSNDNYNILYLHSSGVMTNPINQCLEDRRDYMTYFLVELWEKNVTLLNEYDTCGCDLRKEPALHYSGNMWWAKSEYIRTLPRPEDMPIILTPRHRAEMWIGNFPEKHYSLWDCGIDVYERHLHRYPPEKYRNETL